MQFRSLANCTHHLVTSIRISKFKHQHEVVDNYQIGCYAQSAQTPMTVEHLSIAFCQQMTTECAFDLIWISNDWFRFISFPLVHTFEFHFYCLMVKCLMVMCLLMKGRAMIPMWVFVLSKPKTKLLMNKLPFHTKIWYFRSQPFTFTHAHLIYRWSNHVTPLPFIPQLFSDRSWFMMKKTQKYDFVQNTILYWPSLDGVKNN